MDPAHGRPVCRHRGRGSTRARRRCERDHQHRRPPLEATSRPILDVGLLGDDPAPLGQHLGDVAHRTALAIPHQNLVWEVLVDLLVSAAAQDHHREAGSTAHRHHDGPKSHEAAHDDHESTRDARIRPRWLTAIQSGESIPRGCPSPTGRERGKGPWTLVARARKCDPRSRGPCSREDRDRAGGRPCERPYGER
jgi:hypothetical protein